jgi:hypothetical protein
MISRWLSRLLGACCAQAQGNTRSANVRRRHRAQAPIGADQGRRFPPGKGQIKTVLDRLIQVASQGLGLQVAIRLHPIH